MKFNQTIIIKRWRPILEEYEKILNKVPPFFSLSQGSLSCPSYQ